MTIPTQPLPVAAIAGRMPRPETTIALPTVLKFADHDELAAFQRHAQTLRMSLEQFAVDCMRSVADAYAGRTAMLRLPKRRPNRGRTG